MVHISLVGLKGMNERESDRSFGQVCLEKELYKIFDVDEG